MKRLILQNLLWLMLLPCMAIARQNNPTAVVELLKRVCGEKAVRHFTFILDNQISTDGSEAFQLGYADQRVTVTANTLSAMTAGLNWYLNNEAHVNITWNNMHEAPRNYPEPTDRRLHTTKATHRYYLNYCTFSYSMAFWDEARWMEEIDWMALHGINLPLQVVGIDAVWYDMLTQRYGFSHEAASRFVAGPAFQGWWLMNNLTGHGGPNPEWWYRREAKLGRAITSRMLDLGMNPCLPGFVGMAPQEYVTSTGVQAYSGKWCGFDSPLLLQPGTAFDDMAHSYYNYIKETFGFSPRYYSMDPVHERGLPHGMGHEGYAALCQAARKAMQTYGESEATWVAQMWQINADQHRIDALPDDYTLLLDLSSERLTYEARYGNHPYLFCMLHNYGGNVGMYGCIPKMLDEYDKHLHTYGKRLVGVGATPEGIETNPVLYELLFQLPWMDKLPTATEWLTRYAQSRYNTTAPEASTAWMRLLKTVYCNTNPYQQGCREPVFCARPNLQGHGASSWAGASYDWDKREVANAAYDLSRLKNNSHNLTYDLVDATRQTLTDLAHTWQMEMGQLEPNSEAFATKSRAFITLMDDIDRLLATMPDFTLSRWVNAARQIAINEGHAADADWLEMNARMLITTWGDGTEATNRGGLRDYGNREWSGLIADYYKPRWEAFFNAMTQTGHCDINADEWFSRYEQPYVHGNRKPFGTYAKARPNDRKARKTACELLAKYRKALLD